MKSNIVKDSNCHIFLNGPQQVRTLRFSVIQNDDLDTPYIKYNGNKVYHPFIIDGLSAPSYKLNPYTNKYMYIDYALDNGRDI